MDSKKTSSRKISRKASRMYTQKKESPLQTSTLDNIVSKHVEFCEPLVSFRHAQWAPSYQASFHLEDRCPKHKESGNKTEESSHMIHEKCEPVMQNRDFKRPSSPDETVVRYLNDHPSIDALQYSDVFFKAAIPARSEEEKPEGSRGEYTETSLSTTQDLALKELQIIESCSPGIISSAHKLDILKHHQHDSKLEKLKERIRRQWDDPEELGVRDHHLEFDDHPVTIVAPENALTPKVRKVASAPPAPSYKGFNPSEAKIHTSDGKVWHEEDFLNLSRELCRDLELQLVEDDLVVKETPAEKRKERRRATKPMHKIQKVIKVPSSDSTPGAGGTNPISTSSWRDGQILAKKILGPPPKVEHQDKQLPSNNKTGKERAIKSGKAESDLNLDAIIKPIPRSPECSRSKVRAENNFKKRDYILHNIKLGEDHVNKDFLPVEIRGILDDLQLDSVGMEQEEKGESQNQKSAQSAFSRSHSPTKRKPDKLSAYDEPQITSKKRHYDTDEVRQYIVRQQEERKKRQNEEKKAQKEATEQKNKRLQELYKKQKEALTNKIKSTQAPELAKKPSQATYSKLLLEQTLLKMPVPSAQESKPEYQPSGESDKENKVQEHPPSATSSSDMSLSEPHPLLRNNFSEPLWIQTGSLSSKMQLPCMQSSDVFSSGGHVSQHLSLDHQGILKKDFDSILSRNHSSAMDSGPLTSQLFLQPTINQYKNKIDRIEALKATAASLSSRIASEAKKLTGASINYHAVWNSECDLLQIDQVDGYVAKTRSPRVREDDVFSTRLQTMLGTYMSHASFDEILPGMGNISEFKKLPEIISPHTAAISLPGSQKTEGNLGDLPKKQTCSVAENKVVLLQDGSLDSISEGPLSDGFLSEEEGEKHPALKTTEELKEKEFRVADKTGYEPLKEFQKEVEKYTPIFPQLSDASRPVDELSKGSPHSVINIFTKSYQLCGKGFEEWSGQKLSTQQPSLLVMSPPASIVSYDDDFMSLHGTGTGTDKKSILEVSCSSSTNVQEFPSRKSSFELQTVELIHHSSGSPSAGSSHSSASSKRRGKVEKLDSFNGISNAPLWDGNQTTAGSGLEQHQERNPLPCNGIFNREQNPDSDNTLEELPGNPSVSLLEKVRSPQSASYPQSPQLQRQLDPVINTAEKNRSSYCPVNVAPGLKPNFIFSDSNFGTNGIGTADMNGSMHFSPAGLQHRMSSELNYLSAIEESVQQISDIERLQGISLAQQESVSLVQILKAQQQQHKWDLGLLKFKAEQEALESHRQLEETRHNTTQAHAESLQLLMQSRHEAAETLQETKHKIAVQQVEAAMLTTDAACHVCEMTELAHTQISDAIGAPEAPVTTLLDQKWKHHSAFVKPLKALSSSSCQESPSALSSKEIKKHSHRKKPSSSVEDEVPVNDSLQNDRIPSIPDERDSTSIATEYSLKFDESMTEDEIEEKSFRSLLPSESHRRINLKKRVPQDYSDEEPSGKTAASPVKELSLPFSGGQDSFSRFTMEMVQQYMKEEEMRAAHQSCLLRLREKALKEKTKAELAWLEHQKKHLRDKGEDDKMPPIRKKQRGLLLKLQQEKAEIKRLQEANKAARKERQLILKQQEEIERIRQTTMKLQEKLKSAGENKLGHRTEDDVKQTYSSSPLLTDAETCSPSSISSCETSSIMQKLKKMHSRMDEKFLTKREQKLMQRRQHAEELLQWKCRLDAEEAEICQIEKQALAAWDKELHKAKAQKQGAGDQKSDQKETASEEDSSVPACSCLNSESSLSEEVGSLAVESGPSKVLENKEQLGSLDNVPTEEMVSTQESPGKHSSTSLLTYSIGEQQHLSKKSQDISHSWSDESLSVTQSETTSDQSDIESRIRALKDELQKRKSVVYQLKKEQRKRQKERLKAQEATLIKQLETYDEFIKKTEAELNRDLEVALTVKPQTKALSSAIEKPKIKQLPLHRSETSKSWNSLPDSERSRGFLESIAEHADAVYHSERTVSTYTKKFIEVEFQTEEQYQTPPPLLKSPRKSRAESSDLSDILDSSALFKDLGDVSKTSHVSLSKSSNTASHVSGVSTNRSAVQGDVESIKSQEYDIEVANGKSVFKAEQKNGPPTSLKRDVCSKCDLLEKKQADLRAECVQDRKNIPKEEDEDEESVISIKSSHTSSKGFLKEASLVSEQIAPPHCSNFEESSSRKEMSKNCVPLMEYCKDNFDKHSLSVGKDFWSQREKYTKTPRSRSIRSEDEVSECLSDNSVGSSIHSERLLELRSPTELMKRTGQSDIEREPPHVDASLRTSVSKTEEEEALVDFSIGDRVLVSNAQPGTLRFKGQTSFAKGFWAGVELDEPKGNNDGAYNGICYFDCKDKHGIFAPPPKISHISEGFDYMVSNENCFSKCKQDQHKSAQDRNISEEEQNRGDASEKFSQHWALKDMSSIEISHAAEENKKLTSQRNHMTDVIISDDEYDEEIIIVNSLKSSIDDNSILSASICHAHRKSSAIVIEETLDHIFPDKWQQQEYAEKSDSPSFGVLEKLATPILYYLLTKERTQLESQLEIPSQVGEELIKQKEKAALLADSLLQAFVKDTVNHLQQIKKVRNEKIQFSNRQICVVQENLAGNELQSIFISSELDDGEEVSSPDMCLRPESLVFGASGQEELAKRLAELEFSREFLSVLGDDQDWFDEDFGLSSRKLPQKQAEESAVLPKIDPPKVPPKSCEEPLAVPHTTEEVEDLVHAAAEDLWMCKKMGHDLRTTSLLREKSDSSIDDDIEAVSKQIYKQVIFDLTKGIFAEIFAEDPNFNQPPWMKPCWITSGYFRRVKDPSDLEGIKNFIATEVLKLLNLKKEPYNKTDWQKMMKFGRKQRDRVDHILVQELHEEEPQWVNYDEDELYVKMKLADGIFEALIRETIEVLKQINNKQEHLLLV